MERLSLSAARQDVQLAASSRRAAAAEGACAELQQALDHSNATAHDLCTERDSLKDQLRALKDTRTELAGTLATQHAEISRLTEALETAHFAVDFHDGLAADRMRFAASGSPAPDGVSEHEAEAEGLVERALEAEHGRHKAEQEAEGLRRQLVARSSEAAATLRHLRTAQRLGASRSSGLSMASELPLTSVPAHSAVSGLDESDCDDLVEIGDVDDFSEATTTQPRGVGYYDELDSTSKSLEQPEVTAQQPVGGSTEHSSAPQLLEAQLLRELSHGAGDSHDSAAAAGCPAGLARRPSQPSGVARRSSTDVSALLAQAAAQANSEAEYLTAMYAVSQAASKMVSEIPRQEWPISASELSGRGSWLPQGRSKDGCGGSVGSSGRVEAGAPLHNGPGGGHAGMPVAGTPVEETPDVGSGSDLGDLLASPISAAVRAYSAAVRTLLFRKS